MRAARNAWERICARLARLPARRITWGLALVFSLWILADVLVLRVTAGLARPTYDAMVRARLWVAPPDPRILIIDIDEASLARMAPEFGRWPWPRDTLATVLAHVEKQQPAAVVWDILFSDPDRLNPGGDAAFDEAARRSRASHFSVVRLPAANDGESRLGRADLPGLWAAAGSGTARVALIAPALPALAQGRLGFNNGYPDRDGVLRRYRYHETLADGGMLKAIPSSVLGALDPAAAQAQRARAASVFYPADGLVAWRGGAGLYPRVSFADVFDQAEGRGPAAMPTFAGKVVLIGATAPSLHDIHPTPLSPAQPGVDTLATVTDNALNGRHIAELPHALQAALAIALCVGIALWVQFKSAVSLDPLMWVLPASLLGLSYLSLHGAPMFLELHLPAALALLFLALLRHWGNLRRDYWLSWRAVPGQPVAVWTWLRATPWTDAALHRLIDAVQLHAPACRVMTVDAQPRWPAKLLWPELARAVAIIGPAQALQSARASLEPALRALARQSLEPTVAAAGLSREQMALLFHSQAADLQKAVTTQDLAGNQ